MYDKKTPENEVLLLAAFQQWRPTDPERLYIKDVMTLRGTDEEDGLPYEARQFQVTVKGLTDWYSFATDNNGRPVPTSITQLAF